MNAPRIMIALLGLVFPCAAQSITPEALKHNHEVPGNVRLAFNRLVAGELNGEEDEIEHLAKAAGMNAVLFEILYAAYNSNQDYPLMRSVFAVLELRADLREEDQLWFRAELKAIWNQPDNTKSVTMKEGGMMLLAKHPGTANEDMMLLYLRESTDGGVIGSAHVALLGLETIGTARALDGLNAYLQMLPAQTNYDLMQRGKVTKLINAITAKSLRAKKGSTSSSSRSPLVGMHSHGTAAKAPEATHSPALGDELASSTPWSVVAVLAVAAIGLLWLLLKKRE